MNYTSEDMGNVFAVGIMLGMLLGIFGHWAVTTFKLVRRKEERNQAEVVEKQ